MEYGKREEGKVKKWEWLSKWSWIGEMRKMVDARTSK